MTANARLLMTGVRIAFALALYACFASSALAQNTASRAVAAPTAHSAGKATEREILTDEEWEQVDVGVERALVWLAGQQNEDGSFATLATGQPGVTSLCTMAYLAHGHVPGTGRYGELLERATSYILSCQKENGLVTLLGPEGSRISRNVPGEIGVAAAYNHAISSLTLSELYGMHAQARNDSTRKAIIRALKATLEMQSWPKSGEDRGGWRYVAIDTDDPDSDLSVTGWQLMFLRSARNEGFDVAEKPIDDAVAYVRRCFSRQYHTFQYATERGDHRSRAMAGAGILALAHAGFHNSVEAQRSGDWILQNGFDPYNKSIIFTHSHLHDRYHYSLFNCCQGMYQLGGDHWCQFFPRTIRTVLANQAADGSWPADSHLSDGQFGSAYTTALVVLSLGAPNQLLPIFQR